MNKNKTKYYGLFYKSHGQWTGPYRNKRLTVPQIDSYVRSGQLTKVVRTLKSKVEFREVK